MVTIKDLNARRGDKNIIDGLSLSFEEKGIYAVLSASEEQRKTLAELITGCRDADGGEVRIGEFVMSRDNVALKRKVRLASDPLSACGDVSAYEYIQFVGSAIGVEREKLARQIEESIDLLGLRGAKDKPVRALSAGQRCRLSIAASLIGNPDVIVIDSALDVTGGKTLEEIYDILGMLGGMKTVILLTAKPAHAKRLCEYAALMANGRIALFDRIADIEAKINDTAETRVSVRGDAEAVMDAVRQMSGVRNVKLIKTSRDNTCDIAIEHEYDAFIKDRLFAVLAAINAPILSSDTVALSLDDVYYTLCVRAEKTEENHNNKKEAAK